jgi:gliding motility-associated-like protein
LAPFQWENNIASGVESSVTQLAPGIYGVTLTDSKGCKDSISVLIEEPDPLTATFQIPQPPLCYGEPTIFNLTDVQGGNGQQLADYFYLLDSSTLSYRGDQTASLFAGSHQVTVVDSKNCQYTESFLISTPDPTEVNFNPDFITVKLGDESQRLQPIINHSTPIAFFKWSPEELLTDPNILTPGITAIEDQIYTLEIEDTNGCMDKASVSVAIDKNRLVYIPNVFSPNNDGVNDLFTLHACTGIQSINSIRIFDRWGRMVAQVDESLPPNCITGIPLWDGGDSDEGTYIYSVVVLFDDNFELTFRGEVSLIR